MVKVKTWHRYVFYIVTIFNCAACGVVKMACELRHVAFVNLLIVGLSLLSCSHASNLVRKAGDYYTSQHGLRKLASIEKEIADAVARYIVVLEKRLKTAKRYLGDYETGGAHFNSSALVPPLSSIPSASSAINANPSADSAYPVAAHPLRAYRLLRRYVQDLPTLEKELRTDDERKFLKLTEKIKSAVPFPTQHDIQGATEGILRVHDTYDMNIDDFTSGNFYGLLTNMSMNAADCFYIGSYALKSTILTRAIQWLERAYRLAVHTRDQTITVREISEKLKNAIFQHNEALNRRSKNPYLFTKPVAFEDVLKDSNNVVRRRVLDKNAHKLYNKQSSFNDLTNFAALCSGKQLRDQSELSKLKCWYEGRQPVNTLMPLKIERHSTKPIVLQLHELISDVMIEKILNSASETMSRSQVHTKASSDHKMVSSTRTSTTAWLHDDDRSSLVKMLSVYRRIEEFTGLTIITAGASELLQVSCYGIAGHFNPHLDTIFNSVENSSLTTEEIRRGDRLATIMFYLSDVIRGGSTAFPRLGVNVEPVKGSAIFWYNMNQQGNPNELSLHGGCPILYGNKCVSNKWIRFNTQSLTCQRESQ